jgi:hypothetical protein
MNRSRAFTIGLGICVLLGLLDVVALAGMGAEGAPPAIVGITGAVLGVITLAAAGLAWRGQRGGVTTVVVSRLLSALLGVPAFFVDEAPDWAQVIVAIAIALTILGVGLLFGAVRQRSFSTARPQRSSP